MTEHTVTLQVGDRVHYGTDVVYEYEFVGLAPGGRAMVRVPETGQVIRIAKAKNLRPAGAPVQHTVRVVPWTWRNGTVHLEVRLASFADESGEVFTHLDGTGPGLFTTACGAKWWGKTSASGLGHSQVITCEACREILRTAKFVSDAS